MLFFCRRRRENLRELNWEGRFLHLYLLVWRKICMQSERWVDKKIGGKTTKPKSHKQCLKLVDLFAPYCRLKNTSLVLTRRTSTCFKDPRRQLMKAMKFGIWQDGRWSTHAWWQDKQVVYQRKALLRVYKSLNQSDDNHNTWWVRLRSAAYHGIVWSPKRKQHPELCFPNKFEHQEEDVGNIIRIVEQQADCNNHYGHLFGWP